MKRASCQERVASQGICEVDCLNPASVAQAQDGLPGRDRIAAAAEVLKVLSNPARLRLLLALRGGELCVCDCAHLLGQTLSAASQHLKELRRLDMVAFRQEGKLAYYRLTDGCWIEVAERALTLVDADAVGGRRSRQAEVA